MKESFLESKVRMFFFKTESLTIKSEQNYFEGVFFSDKKIDMAIRQGDYFF